MQIPLLSANQSSVCISFNNLNDRLSWNLQIRNKIFSGAESVAKKKNCWNLIMFLSIVAPEGGLADIFFPLLRFQVSCSARSN